jgi:hypothetical protein
MTRKHINIWKYREIYAFMANICYMLWKNRKREERREKERKYIKERKVYMLYVIRKREHNICRYKRREVKKSYI